MTARILILDIERIPGEATVPFWDLGAFKNRRIPADYVTTWPQTICAAWKWQGTSRVEFSSVWGDGNDLMLRRIWDAYDRADIVVGHNLKNFDTKHLVTGWMELGLTPPSPFKIVDTLTVARRVLGAESKTLDALCRRFGLPSKTDKYDVEMALKAVEGDVKAQRQITAYNKGDIGATEAWYDFLKVWDAQHPHLGLYVETAEGDKVADAPDTCPVCKGTRFTRQGYAYTGVSKFQRYKCATQGCGRWLRGRHAIARVDIRTAS